MTFIAGATLAHYTGDKDEKRAEVQDKLEQFDAEFLAPSIARRQELLDSGAETPADVLTILLANDDNLHLPHEVVRREVAFYLLAGAHTSATAFTRTLHEIFRWIETHPDDADRVRSDRLFLQRCMHETVRLQPSSPVAMRWALEDVELKSGRQIPKGAKTVTDMMAVNRDVSKFGSDADDFNPHRELADGVTPWGLSFGSGMHACIGADLAGGLPFPDGENPDDHLYGLVPEALMAMMRAGARPDPTDAPEMDTTTARPYWGRYPVLLG
jgi:cytochrome P450